MITILENDISRFISAQEFTFPIALKEIRQGHKKTHWMWFIFPQICGLGMSAPAQRYGIKSAAEAQEYITHPVLGPRLIEITTAVLEHKSKTAESIFGYPDVLKFQSCMTLFWLVSRNEVFKEALDCFYDGKLCEYTKNNI